MTHYMLSMYQPGLQGEAPPPDVLEPIMRDVAAVHQQMRDAGVRVFGAGLRPPNAATVVRAAGDEVLTTDGPYAEGKEHIGGFTMIEVNDHEAALEWGRKLSEATTLPVEVRPAEDGTCG